MYVLFAWDEMAEREREKKDNRKDMNGKYCSMRERENTAAQANTPEIGLKMEIYVA